MLALDMVIVHSTSSSIFPTPDLGSSRPFTPFDASRSLCANMSNTEYPRRASLEGLANDIFNLVARGAKPKQWAGWLRVPLEHAPADRIDPKLNSLEGFGRQIFKLVSRGATDEQWSGWLRVPLEHAAAAGNIYLFNELIEAGANGSAGWRGCDGRTLLYAAAQGGNAEVVSALLAAGAGPDVNVVPQSLGSSPLFLATACGHEEAARRLVKAGADVHFLDPVNDMEALVQAARSGFEGLVNDLLAAGADPNKRDGNSGEAPLHTAAEYGSKAMVSALLVRGANIDPRDYYGDSPLIKAAAAGHVTVVDSLLAAGADVEVRNRIGYRALETAATRHGHIGVLKAILRHGVAVNDKDGDACWTALHLAATRDDENAMDAIDALVEAGADIESEDMGSSGRTPLSYAADGCRWMTVLALLRHGAISDVRNNQGDNLLHVACCRRQEGLEKTVDLLLRAGVDETAVNKGGKTPAALISREESLVLFGSRDCSPEELERARHLVTRAPNDRAWRRRCWLVMLSSRGSRAGTAGCGNGDGGGPGSSAADGREDHEDSKMARSEHADGGESGVVEQANVTGLGGEDGGLRAVVAALFGLELEGVFRTVVGFL